MKILTALLVGLLSPAACFALQKPLDNGKSDPFFARTWRGLQSPWNTSARPILLWGTGVTVALAILEDQITDPIQDDTVEDRPLGSASWVGDLAGQGIPNAAYVLGMGSYYVFTRDPDAKNSTIAMVESSLYSTVAAHALKYVVHENRPDNKSGHRNYDSFPSGHTTSAFAFASTVVAQHGMWPYGFLASSLAAFSGFSRINDNRHYLHDVVGGITLGTAYGLGVSYYRRGDWNQLQGSSARSTHLEVYPVMDGFFKGLLVSYQFH